MLPCWLLPVFLLFFWQIFRHRPSPMAEWAAAAPAAPPAPDQGVPIRRPVPALRAATLPTRAAVAAGVAAPAKPAEPVAIRPFPTVVGTEDRLAGVTVATASI